MRVEGKSLDFIFFREEFDEEEESIKKKETTFQLSLCV